MAEKKGSDRRAERRKQRAAERGSVQPAQKGKIREWLDALVFAVVVMLIVRTLLFDLFRIPTPSMEKSLLVGDYLFVSKLHYGTRTPRTLGIPFTDLYVRGVTIPNTRLPGFSEVKRYDSVVFNWPADGDKPVDRRMHYIKWIIGLPGETVQVRDKVVYVDGEPLELLPGMQQMWDIYKTEPRVRLSGSALTDLGVTDVLQTTDPSVVRVSATTAAVREIESWPWVQSVRPAIAQPNPVYDSNLYPPGFGFTPDNYGPLPIPSRGQTVALSAENWAYYGTAVTRYEGHTVEIQPDSTFLIDGAPADSFTFAQDYFFVMGDNRDNSEDARFWGYVPMDHIVGKAVMIYFSWDAAASLPRFERLFSFVR